MFLLELLWGSCGSHLPASYFYGICSKSVLRYVFYYRVLPVAAVPAGTTVSYVELCSSRIAAQRGVVPAASCVPCVWFLHAIIFQKRVVLQ